MRRLKKHFSLIEVEPGLVKEWHPSANPGLTPRNVTIAYPRKVWWICSEGHEWKATIKCRMKGNGCPLCEQNKNNHPLQEEKNSAWQEETIPARATSAQPNIFVELDPSDANIDHDFRKSRRFMVAATAILEVPSSGHWFYAQIRNFSHAGMYVETEAAFKPGTKIKVNIDQPLFSTTQKSYSSIIRWCKLLDEDNPSFSNYGLGMIFI
jgi:hypothetical protein